ncbi:eukaryotic translation initiation factor 3 subunit A-like isoform X1, partial [Achlya hypogyna]
MKLLSTVALVAMALNHVEGHGRLIAPPHRGYIGKLPQFKDVVPTDYSDHGLNAGGIQQTKGGKHGVCGDPYNGARDHETGGMYGLFPTHGSKVIGACYAPGATVDLQVQITANHKGFFEFGLCKLNGKGDKETEECFQTLTQPNGEKQWQLPAGNDFFKMQYTLPKDVKCDGDSHCVLRWWYAGGNNPGVGLEGQEQFWNCADIYISDSCGSTPTSSPKTDAPTTAPTAAPTEVPTEQPTEEP